MNYIRDIYKKDYRGFEMLPARRTGVKEKYSVKKNIQANVVFGVFKCTLDDPRAGSKYNT